MRRSAHIFCFTILLAGLLPGCVAVEVGVANPVPNLPRIAITPFVNLSSERSVDGRRFAEAYYTELQKVPGFQVIPVGVVDSAIHDHNLNLDTPEDLLQLAKILGADGICLGAITEYTPYYPPRLGLQISWYTPDVPNFQPGIPIWPVEEPPREKRVKPVKGKKREKSGKFKASIRKVIPCLSSLPVEESNFVIRAQNTEPVLPEATELKPVEQGEWDKALREAMDLDENIQQEKAPGLFTPGFHSPQKRGEGNLQPEQAPFPDLHQPEMQQNQIQNQSPSTQPQPDLELSPLWGQNQPIPQILPLLPEAPPVPVVSPDVIAGGSFTQPYMSYTRVFDGADAKFTAALRNYLELGGDERSGGWTGHLHRSEDFIRFCMHRSIVEMLQLHGGETKRRFVLTSRKYQ